LFGIVKFIVLLCSMKNILFISALLISSILFGQDTLTQDGKFNTEFETGFGVKVPMTFNVSGINLEKIKSSPEFKVWEEQTFSNPKNADYIEKNKNKTHIEMFLMSELTMSSFFTKFKLKNGNSYTPINGTSSLVYVPKDGGINITFNFQAQNGYGNMIYSTSITTVKLVDGKIDYETFVY